MFTQILKHDYDSPLPLRDLTEKNGDAVAQNAFHNFGGLGGEPGYYRFDGAQSRIGVPLTELWRDLTFLRVDCEIWIDAHGKRHNLVEGYLSFALYVRASGILSATIYTLVDDDSFLDTLGTPTADPDTPSGGILGPQIFDSNLGVDPEDPEGGDGPVIPAGKKLDWRGVNSDAPNAPDGVARTVPVGEWVTVSFVRDADGFRLFMNGELVGVRAERMGLVRSVQGPGVTIGAWPGSNAYTLDGRIRTLGIWKYDHRLRLKRFMCGVQDAREKLYLYHLYARLQRALDDPETADLMQEVLACVNAAEQAFLAAIRDSGADRAAEADMFFSRYTEIWCSGSADGDRMKAHNEEWMAWVMAHFSHAFITYQCEIMRCLGRLREIGICEDVAGFAKLEGVISGFSKATQQAYLAAFKSFPCAPGPGTGDPTQKGGKPEGYAS